MLAELRLPFAALLGCFAVLFAAPLGKGDLPGYDDALYAHIAKRAYTSGDWLHLQSNGYPALEHPPLLPWIEAGLFHLFGVSDVIARIPSAACGLGSVVLVWWLARRLLADEYAALLAMFCMGTSIYFLKYAARAMTDVPFAFLFLCAICCWKLAERRPAWLFVAALFTAATQMTRGLMGLALPLIFLADGLWSRRRIAWGFILPAIAVAFVPPALWYWHLTNTYGQFFTDVHAQFLRRDLTSPNPFTPLIFAGMLAKSYWPWFPAMLAGLWIRRTRLLLIWIGAVFAACVVVRNPVLRYLLPAYPAFAIASGAALRKWIPQPRMRPALRYIAPALAAAVAAVAILSPARHDAAELRQMAASAASLTRNDERVAFYDGGAPRFDESNLLQWYGARDLYILENRDALNKILNQSLARVFVIDNATFKSALATQYKCIAITDHFCAAVRKSDLLSTPMPVVPL